MSFDFLSFAGRLLAESLFYDEEFGAIGTVSLINEEVGREAYIAYYIPEEGRYLIDVATDWESFNPNEDEGIGYAFASDTEIHTSSKSQEEVAKKLLSLAIEETLSPSFAVLFEEEMLG